MTDYRTHPEYRALLAAVCAAPGDDLPRLVLADWLEEHGKEERSEFIRVQCELAHFGEDDLKEQKPHWIPVCEPGYRRWERAQALRRRERKLVNLKQPRREWFNVPPPLVLKFDTIGDHPGTFAIVRRGFVAEVRCRLAEWCGGACDDCDGTGRDASLPDADWTCRKCSGTGRTTGIGPRLVREHPVEVVRVVDRVAANIDSPMKFAWHTATEWRNVPHHIPPAVWSNLKGGDRCANCPYCWGYPTRDAADAALSAALIAWAKSQGVGDE